MKDKIEPWINSIVSRSFGNGNASRALDTITSLADIHEVPLMLCVSPLRQKQKRIGGILSKTDLIAWYKRHGFERVSDSYMRYLKTDEICNQKENDMITYEEYMSGPLDSKSFHEFYKQFVTPNLVKAVVSQIGISRIMDSTDAHMNDIPLQNWDRLEGIVMIHSEHKLREAIRGVSLADCVCVAKEAARVAKFESDQK